MHKVYSYILRQFITVFKRCAKRLVGSLKCSTSQHKRELFPAWNGKKPRARFFCDVTQLNQNATEVKSVQKFQSSSFKMKMNYSKGTSWQDVENLLCKLEKSDEELERILPWFYEHVKCFKQVKEGLLILATSDNTDGSSILNMSK